MLVFAITVYDQLLLIETLPVLLPLFSILQLTRTAPNLYPQLDTWKMLIQLLPSILPRNVKLKLLVR